MKKVVAILVLSALVISGVAYAAESFDFSISNSIFNKYVYSSAVYNDDSSNWATVTAESSNLVGTDSVVFSVVDANKNSISNGVTFVGDSLPNWTRTMDYDTDKTYCYITTYLRGKFSPRSYSAFVRGDWAP